MLNVRNISSPEPSISVISIESSDSALLLSSFEYRSKNYLRILFNCDLIS